MGVRGFRPSGRVPFAAMQKEPKNRWGTARGTSGFALRPNGLTPRPRNRGPAALRWTDVAKLIRRTLPVQLRNSGRFTGDTCIPTTMRRKPCSRCVSPPWPAGAARCGVSLNQEVLNRAGQTGQVPGCTICKRRRRWTVAETFSFLTTQGLGGPDAIAAKPEIARRMRETLSQSDTPRGPGPQPRGTLATFLPWKVARPRAKHPLSSVPPAGDHAYKQKFI